MPAIDFLFTRLPNMFDVFISPLKSVHPDAYTVELQHKATGLFSRPFLYVLSETGKPDCPNIKREIARLERKFYTENPQ